MPPIRPSSNPYPNQSANRSAGPARAATVDASRSNDVDDTHKRIIVAQLETAIQRNTDPWGKPPRYTVSEITLGPVEPFGSTEARSFSLVVDPAGRRGPKTITGTLHLDSVYYTTPYVSPVRFADEIHSIFADPRRPRSGGYGLFDVFVGAVGASPRQ